MTVANFFDKTPANLVRPGTQGVNRTTGKFNQTAETTTAINIHIVQPNSLRPRLDEALPGGIHIETGDLIVFADTSIGIQPTDILEFWGDRYKVLVELRRYDVLDSVLQYQRRSYLVRRHGTYDG